MWQPTLILISLLCFPGPSDGPDVVPTEQLAQAACPELRRCRSALPSSGTISGVTVFREVRWDLDEVELQYNGDGAAALGGWSICTGPDRCATIPSHSLSSRVTLHMVESGGNTNRHIYLSDDELALEGTGELALYRTADPAAFGAETIEAYVRWGDAAAGQTLGDHAAQIWPAGEFVEICAEADGFVANGNVYSKEGFHAQPSECFR